jgi:hypothetical protein
VRRGVRRGGSRAGRLTPLRSCTAKRKPLARTQSEIAYAERIGAARPAVAYGSAVNEGGGNRTPVLAERRKPPGSGAKPFRPGAKNKKILVIFLTHYDMLRIITLVALLGRRASLRLVFTSNLQRWIREAVESIVPKRRFPRNALREV